MFLWAGGMASEIAAVDVKRGQGPIILGMPHTGTHVPADIAARLNSEGRFLRDTDWHVERLYDGLLPGATIVRATFHRYVIDANRDPSGASLYPGQNTTELVPLTNFDGDPIWNEAPDEQETARRLLTFHKPYHDALASEIARVKASCGVAILYDCHSIRSRIPHLFDGVLPDLNIGTNGGTTCAPSVEGAVIDAAMKSNFTHVVNGRFKGGWTTRHYGRPKDSVHAIQMELAQSRYLVDETAPFAYDTGKAESLRVVLKSVLEGLEAAARSLMVTRDE